MLSSVLTPQSQARGVTAIAELDSGLSNWRCKVRTKKLSTSLKAYDFWPCYFDTQTHLVALFMAYNIFIKRVSFDIFCIIKRCIIDTTWSDSVSFHQWVKIQDVIHTADSDFTMSLLPLSKTPRCHCYRWVRLRNVIVTAESDSPMSLLPLSQTPRCHCYRWVWLHSVMDTADYRVVYENGRLESFAVTFDCFSRDVLIAEIMTHYDSTIVDT